MLIKVNSLDYIANGTEKGEPDFVHHNAVTICLYVENLQTNVNMQIFSLPISAFLKCFCNQQRNRIQQ